MNQPILQLDRCIDEELGMAVPTSTQDVPALRSTAELEEVVRALAEDSKSLAEFSNKRAVRAHILAQVAVNTAPRRSVRRISRGRSRLMALGAACLLLSTTSAAFAGVLPEPVQTFVAQAAQKVGVDLPDPAPSAPLEKSDSHPVSSKTAPAPRASDRAEAQHLMPPRQKQPRGLTSREPLPLPSRPREDATPPPARGQTVDLEDDVEVEEIEVVEAGTTQPDPVEVEELEEPEEPEEPEGPDAAEPPEPEADDDD